MYSSDNWGQVIRSYERQKEANLKDYSQKSSTLLHFNSLTPSIKELKQKIKNIENFVKEKKTKVLTEASTYTPRSQPQISPYLRKTQSFLRVTNQPSASNEEKKELSSCQTLISKANESIRKSYQLTMKQKNDQFEPYNTPINLKKNMQSSATEQKNIAQNIGANAFLKKQKMTRSAIEPHLTNSLTSVKKGQNVIKSVEIQNAQETSPKIMFVKNKDERKLNKLKCRHACSTELDESFVSRISNGFLFGKVLGKGKFGEVYVAQHIETGFIVAIKKVAKQKLIEDKMVNRFIEEIKLHSTLDHPNIVKFYGFFQQTDSICLVLEYLNGGTLFDYLNDFGPLSLKETVSVLKDIIDGLDYLHQRNIAHRDIKPQNIVISSTGLAKLCDFGWSAVVENPRSTFCGTLDYASPEIIERKQYDQSVDVWCVGVLTYEMLIGKAPFESGNRQEVMQGILNVNVRGIPEIGKLPAEAREFIESLLQKDPSARPKIFQLLCFPLFNLQGEVCRRQKHFFP